MSEARIIAVSFHGGESVEHISYVWTASGAMPVQRVVDDLWRRRCAYYTMSAGVRVALGTLPARGPTLIGRLLGQRLRGRLQSAPVAGRAADALLSLPKLPSPNRGRRSEQKAAQGAGAVSRI